jgi:hypothetical protein
MSLFSGPEEHAANPPATWTVDKPTDQRLWYLMAGDVNIDTFPTKRAAEAAKVSGWLVELYDKEARWYAGEVIKHWKPYADVVAENAKRVAWLNRTK